MEREKWRFINPKRKFPFSQLSLLIGIFVLVGCRNNEQKIPEITIQPLAPILTPSLDIFSPAWPDQEVLLKCTIEWDGEKRGVFTRYDPEQDNWHSKRILSYSSHFDGSNILSDDYHWIVRVIDGFDKNEWPLFSYSLNHNLGEIPIETEAFSRYLSGPLIHSSYEQPNEYLLEQVCTECASSYWWIDVNKCHEGDCQPQPLELGYPSSKSMWRNFWSPDFKHLFMYDYQDWSSRLILTDHDGLLLYDFGDKMSTPLWFDSTNFGFWSKSSEQEDAVFYYGSVDDGEIHPLFSKSDLFPLLPALPRRVNYSYYVDIDKEHQIVQSYWDIHSYGDINARINETKFVLSFSVFYDEPEPKDKSNLLVIYDQSTGNFDVLWESFGRRNQYFSPDRTKIYISTEYHNPWQTNNEWRVIDLLSGQISTTNWLPLNGGYRSDLSYDTEWRVNFVPVTKESDQIITGAPQSDLNQMILANRSGFQKIIEYPEGVSNCSGGWVFK